MIHSLKKPAIRMGDNCSLKNERPVCYQMPPAHVQPMLRAPGPWEERRELRRGAGRQAVTCVLLQLSPEMISLRPVRQVRGREGLFKTQALSIPPPKVLNLWVWAQTPAFEQSLRLILQQVTL